MLPHRTGQLLVASRQLLDPNFVHTVVLVVQQDEEGVIGLVLNRPLDITVADACEPSTEEAADVREALFQGGPCPGPLMVLHDDGLVGGTEVVSGVHFTTERDQIQALMRGQPGHVRYFAGYAGWSPRQLEEEIDQGAWLSASAGAEHVFSESTPTLWTTLTTQLTVGKWVNLDRLPEDPTVN